MRRVHPEPQAAEDAPDHRAIGRGLAADVGRGVGFSQRHAADVVPPQDFGEGERTEGPRGQRDEVAGPQVGSAHRGEGGVGVRGDGHHHDIGPGHRLGGVGGDRGQARGAGASLALEVDGPPLPDRLDRARLLRVLPEQHRVPGQRQIGGDAEAGVAAAEDGDSIRSGRWDGLVTHRGGTSLSFPWNVGR